MAYGGFLEEWDNPLVYGLRKWDNPCVLWLKEGFEE